PRRRRRSAAAVGAGSAPRGTRSRRTWPNVQSMPPEPSSAAAATRPPRGLSGRLHTPRLRSVRSVRWVWAAAAFVAVVLLAIEWPVLAVLYGLHPAAAMVLAMTHSAAVVLTVRWPLVGIAVSSFGSLATMLATFPMAAVLPWPWPVTGILAHCLLVALLSLRHQWYWVAGGWGAGTVLTALAFVVTPERTLGGLANGVVLVSVTAGLAMLGVLERLWRQGAIRVRS